MSNDGHNKDTQDPSLLQITLSVIASFLGVQSDRNLDKDDAFIEKAGFKPYIIIGVILTLIFVVLVYAVVLLILNFATA